MENSVIETVVQNGTLYAVIGAALSCFLGGLGSVLGIYSAAVKSAGILSERPDLFGKMLVLCALPGSQGIYGLLISVMIMQTAGLLGNGDAVALSQNAGYALMFSGFLMGLAGLFSAIYQGKVAAAGASAVAKDESLGGRMIVMAVLVETYAITGLLIALFGVVSATKLS